MTDTAPLDPGPAPDLPTAPVFDPMVPDTPTDTPPPESSTDTKLDKLIALLEAQAAAQAPAPAAATPAGTVFPENPPAAPHPAPGFPPDLPTAGPNPLPDATQGLDAPPADGADDGASTGLAVGDTVENRTTGQVGQVVGLHPSAAVVMVGWFADVPSWSAVKDEADGSELIAPFSLDD